MGVCGGKPAHGEDGGAPPESVPDGGVKQAWKALLPAFDKFPREAIISFNLSCYACQMKLLDAARVWLKRAVVLGNKRKIKEMALADKDLEALWPEIDEL